MAPNVNRSPRISVCWANGSADGRAAAFGSDRAVTTPQARSGRTVKQYEVKPTRTPVFKQDNTRVGAENEGSKHLRGLTADFERML